MSDSNGLNLPTSIPGLDNGGSGLDGLSEFAQGILNQIPEEDRATVAKYYKDWDGNVTKKFQSIHEEYKPYKELGDVDSLREALTWVSALNEDPVAFINMVKEAMKESGIVYENDDDDKSNLPEYEGLPQAVVEQLRSLQETVGSLTEKVGTFEGTAKEREEQAAFDNMLSELHTRHGDFDDDWVVLQIARGIDPDEAAKSFPEYIGKYSSPKPVHKPAPNLFQGASGSVPNQVDMSKLSREEKKAAAVELLKAMQSQG
jgi:hypothetical protein